MNFSSDNAGPVHPKVMAALDAANTGYALPYGNDPLTDAAVAMVRETFAAPGAEVLFVGNGTVANALLLSALSRPWETVFCAPHAHIHEDECAAPEFFGHGLKLTPVAGATDKIRANALSEILDHAASGSIHSVAPGPVSLTQATERGTVYSLSELREITSIAHAHGLPVHMDGARFANALATLGCSPAELTHLAGVDALSLGGTKNGLMGVEAMVVFDPDRAPGLARLRKRGGQLFSKNRYLAAQMLAYLTGGLWQETATQANLAARALADGLRSQGAEILFPVEANIVFAAWPRATHRRLIAAGAQYHLWDDSLDGDDPEERLTARLVCDWSNTRADRETFLDLF